MGKRILQINFYSQASITLNSKGLSTLQTIFCMEYIGQDIDQGKDLYLISLNYGQLADGPTRQLADV